LACSGSRSPPKKNLLTSFSAAVEKASLASLASLGIKEAGAAAEEKAKFYERYVKWLEWSGAEKAKRTEVLDLHHEDHVEAQQEVYEYEGKYHKIKTQETQEMQGSSTQLGGVARGIPAEAVGY
jgi:hypothetical protein